MKMLALLLAMLLVAAAPSRQATPNACAVGSYATGDGGFVDIATDGDGLRWRRPDGTTGALKQDSSGKWKSSLGWTERPDGVAVSFDCSRGSLIIDGKRGERIRFNVTETRFDVGGATLAGRLILPRGNKPVPIVVLVHGAERMSALDRYALQRMFPAAGIGAFVYDKRGTGGSTGQYTHDYATLATDAVAAAGEARRIASKRASRIGYQAGSQGGWVAPLAARIEPVDFLIVSFGLAVSPAAAERELVADELAKAGFKADAIASAMEVNAAVEAVIDSNFQSGYDRLAEVRARYGGEPWFKHVKGSFIGIILGMTEEQLRKDGPSIAPNISLYYDPMPVLRNLDTPQLWILGSDDIVAPPGETSRRLKALKGSGRPIALAVFEGAEHGLYQYEIAPDGSRVATRAPEGYFRMMRDFILTGRSGSAQSAPAL